MGDGSVESNDIDLSAADGSSVAFGDGASSSAESQDVEVYDNSGTVQVADDGTQTGVTDNSINDSFNNTDSFNTDIEQTDNSIDDSFDVEDSFNVDESETDNSVDIQDNDLTVDGGLL